MGIESIVVFITLGTLGVFHAVVLKAAGRQRLNKPESHHRSGLIANLVKACQPQIDSARVKSYERKLRKIRSEMERATSEFEIIVKKRDLCSRRLKRLKHLSVRKRKKHLEEITRLTILRNELAAQAQSVLARAVKIQSKSTDVNKQLSIIAKNDATRQLLRIQPQNITQLMANSSIALAICHQASDHVESIMELREELAKITAPLPFKRRSTVRSCQLLLDQYEVQVLENEKRAEDSAQRKANPASNQTAPKPDESTFEYILQTHQTFAQLVEKSMRQRGQFAILLDGNIERNLERLSSLIKSAHHTLSSSVDHETEIERELHRFNATYSIYQGDGEGNELEQSRETFKATLRTLRYRNLLLFQRLFEIEIFAERLNHIRLLLELLPTSMHSEISEWTKTSSVILSALQRLSDHSEMPFKASDFAARINKLEQTVQMAFIDFIKRDKFELQQTSPKVVQFKRCLEVFEKACAAHSNNYSYWDEQGMKGMENRHEFVIAVSRLRCERYAEMQINAERNADVIKIAMTKCGVA
jgi:hypothetical protein